MRSKWCHPDFLTMIEKNSMQVMDGRPRAATAGVQGRKKSGRRRLRLLATHTIARRPTRQPDTASPSGPRKRGPGSELIWPCAQADWVKQRRERRLLLLGALCGRRSCRDALLEAIGGQVSSVRRKPLTRTAEMVADECLVGCFSAILTNSSQRSRKNRQLSSRPFDARGKGRGRGRNVERIRRTRAVSGLNGGQSKTRGVLRK